MNAQGNNFRIRLSLSAVPKLYAYPFFFSARLYSDYALVTIKERDKNLFMQILEKGNETIINRHNATPEDVMALAKMIQDRVEEQFGINLQREVIYI